MTWKTLDWIAGFGESSHYETDNTPLEYAARLIRGLLLLAMLSVICVSALFVCGIGVVLGVYVAFVRFPAAGISIFALFGVAYLIGFIRLVKKHRGEG